MATTRDQDPGQFEAGFDVIHDKIAASTEIPAGTLAMNDGGEAKPFTSAGYVAGAKLLGVANARYSNPTGAAVSGVKMVFRRGTPAELDGKAGDLPVGTDVGGLVTVTDNFSVQKTAIVNGLAVFLLKITGSVFRVLIP